MVHVDIFNDGICAYFQSVLDSVLKELYGKGVGTTKKQVEVIPDELEKQLCEEGISGDDTPGKFLDIMVYFFHLHFALHYGREHRNIRPDMLEVVESGLKPYLLYIPNLARRITQVV